MSSAPGSSGASVIILTQSVPRVMASYASTARVHQAFAQLRALVFFAQERRFHVRAEHRRALPAGHVLHPPESLSSARWVASIGALIVVGMNAATPVSSSPSLMRRTSFSPRMQSAPA